MNWPAIAVYIVAVIVFIGWLLYQLRRVGRSSIPRHENAGTKPAVKPTTNTMDTVSGGNGTAMEPHNAVSRGDELATVTGAEPGFDDLTRIKGIGKVIATQLNDLGVTTFARIAAFTAKDIQRLDKILPFKGRIERDDWVGQAKRLGREKNN